MLQLGAPSLLPAFPKPAPKSSLVPWEGFLTPHVDRPLLLGGPPFLQTSQRPANVLPWAFDERTTTQPFSDDVSQPIITEHLV